MPRANRLPLLLLPFAALIAILPLLLHGVSCGQDMPFHLQSWLDAAHQLGQGDYPRWASTPAWNAGEPRFIFYPPISWLLGAALTSLLPITAAPIAYIFIALVASGLAMYYLAKQYTSPATALIAAAFYLANPYILFCIYERTAFAELLAAAWIPLLFAGIFKARPTVRGIAIPLALLWLTNAPAAVMGSYTFALLAILRIAFSALSDSSSPSQPSGSERTAPSSFRLTQTFLYATILGLMLPAFYLVPAAYERRFVQVAMAIIPNMRVQDNYLFTLTSDAAHNAVNHTVSLLAVTVLALTIATIIGLFILSPSPISDDAPLLTDNQLAANETKRTLATALAIVTVVIALLLTPVSSLLWLHLPNMQYLQFPWRLLTILSAVLAFAFALIIHRLTHRLTHTLSSRPERSAVERPAFAVLSAAAALALPLILTFVGYNLYAQACDTASLPTSIATLFTTHHGAPPTDEYTPTDADNDLLRSDNPGYWLAPTVNAPAPNTTPTASERNPNIATDDTPVPNEQTLSTPAPRHFTIHANHPGILVLNLRDYPNWRITVKGYFDHFPLVPKRLQRDDGLLAIPLAAGASIIDISWNYTRDEIIGFTLSALALMLLLWSPEPANRH
jgi:hypothetical protein